LRQIITGQQAETHWDAGLQANLHQSGADGLTDIIEMRGPAAKHYPQRHHGIRTCLGGSSSHHRQLEAAWYSDQPGLTDTNLGQSPAGASDQRRH